VWKVELVLCLETLAPSMPTVIPTCALQASVVMTTVVITMLMAPSLLVVPVSMTVNVILATVIKTQTGVSQSAKQYTGWVTTPMDVSALVQQIVPQIIAGMTILFQVIL
jgi:hypothetical protein